MRTVESTRRSARRGLRPNVHTTRVAPVVVCGIDDPVAERDVLAFTADLVEQIGGRVVLAHVQPPPLLDVEPQIAYAVGEPDRGGRLTTVAQRLARLAAEAGIAPTTRVHVSFGDPEEHLLATARAEDAAVIVIGDRAASASGRSGSLARRLIERAPCPVVVLPHELARDAEASGDWGHEPIGAPAADGDARFMTASGGDHVTQSIVCGVDDSFAARAALRIAAGLADRLAMRLVVAHVVQPPAPRPGPGPTARQLAEMPVDALLGAGEALVEGMLEEQGLGNAERRVVLGFPGDRLADVADDEAAQLLVVGSRGRGVVKAALLGSVSTDVIGVARCPVLVVPPGAADAPSAQYTLTAVPSDMNV